MTNQLAGAKKERNPTQDIKYGIFILLVIPQAGLGLFCWRKIFCRPKAVPAQHPTCMPLSMPPAGWKGKTKIAFSSNLRIVQSKPSLCCSLKIEKKISFVCQTYGEGDSGSICHTGRYSILSTATDQHQAPGSFIVYLGCARSWSWVNTNNEWLLETWKFSDSCCG